MQFSASSKRRDLPLHLRLPPALHRWSCYSILWAVQLTVTQLTDRLIESYAQAGGINHLDGKNLPSKTAITTITCGLLRLVFPGFFDDKPIHSSEIKVETASLLDTVLGNLEDEIAKSLEYNPPRELPKKDLRPIARTWTIEFLASLPRI